jgi:hypothetical protein
MMIEAVCPPCAPSTGITAGALSGSDRELHEARELLRAVRHPDRGRRSFRSGSVRRRIARDDLCRLREAAGLFAYGRAFVPPG